MIRPTPLYLPKQRFEPFKNHITQTTFVAHVEPVPQMEFATVS